MDGASVLWYAGGACVLLAALLVALLSDPMLLYVALVGLVMAVFPTYKGVTLAASLFGVYRIALRNDVVLGDYRSLVTSTGEALGITLGGLVLVVTAMAAWPALQALFTLDLGAFAQNVRPALALVALSVGKYAVENAGDLNTAEFLDSAMVHGKELVKNLRLLGGLAR